MKNSQNIFNSGFQDSGHQSLEDNGSLYLVINKVSPVIHCLAYGLKKILAVAQGKET
jgi:hypothetical protein